MKLVFCPDISETGTYRSAVLVGRASRYDVRVTCEVVDLYLRFRGTGLLDEEHKYPQADVAGKLSDRCRLGREFTPGRGHGLRARSG